MKRLALIVALLAVACGEAGVETSAAPSTNPGASAPTEPAATVPPTSSSTTTDAPLMTYAYTMRLSVEGADGSVRPVSELTGTGTEAGPVTIEGELGSEPIHLAFDGTSWWDATDPQILMDSEAVRSFLTTSGFLQPSEIAPLLAADDAWTTIGSDTRHGVETTHIRRVGIVKDVDWSYGDLTSLDVWLEPDGSIVELVARWATGDNSGFPISSWEVTARNVEVVIPVRPEG